MVRDFGIGHISITLKQRLPISFSKCYLILLNLIFQLLTASKDQESPSFIVKFSNFCHCCV